MNQDIERWKRELYAAGWVSQRSTVWRAPSGALYLGPYGAWKAMKNIGCDEHDDCLQGPCKVNVITR